MNVMDFCSREVATVAPHDSLREASFTMRNRHVGALVVVDEARRPVGIVTDRDIVVAVIAVPDARPDEIRVGDLMQKRLVTVREDDGVFQAVATMQRFGVRRLVVLGAHGMLAGVVSADDVLRVLAGELDRLARAFGGAAMREALERRPIDPR